MPTVRLQLEYDGSRYAGWQRQPDQPSVQQALETALHHLTQEAVAVVGAGRTDAGVHALGQVASFRIKRQWTSRQWIRGLNAWLPDDVAVRAAATVPDGFHARYAARGKLYEYRILNRAERPALERAYLWHIHKPLEQAAMEQAAAHLVGSHDFSSFEGTLTDNEDPVCDLRQLSMARQGDLLLVQAYADRFLKHMVRAIVGTLVEVGHGKRTADSLKAVLAAKDRRAAGRTAPAHGLYLVRVDYES
ncbi:MAG TPA: tRNA pseudouridine(38-40) synthase TruA [Nitrospira sp.]|jgi:tRNA pseudouridine38-40 synthase|nr:tRNA pseudouridine(38-40) synthase TruA [Nitrospira sp.]